MISAVSPKISLKRKADGTSTYSFLCYLGGIPRCPKHHRVLSRPHDQGLTLTCCCHAFVKALECRFRVAKAKGQLHERFDCYWVIPELSIQSCVDMFFPGPDNIKMVVFILQTQGVSTERLHPFGAPPTFSILERPFKAGDINVWECDVRKFEILNYLMKWLDNNGAFVGIYLNRENRREGDIFTEDDGEIIYDIEGKPKSHAVLIKAFNGAWSVARGIWEGYWVYVDSGGSFRGLDGCGRITFDALCNAVTVDLRLEDFNLSHNMRTRSQQVDDLV